MVAVKRLLAGLAALEHHRELATARQPEVQRGPDPLRGQRQAMARGVADEEHSVLGRIPQGVGDPVALVADPVGVEVVREPLGRLADVEARVERADADPQLAVGREAPPVAGRHVGPVDPHLEIVAGPEWVDLESSRQQRIGRLDVGARAEYPPPAERVDDQPGADLAAIGVDGVPRAAVHLGRLELERPAPLGQQPAQGPVVERRERPREVVADRRVRRVDHELAEGLLQSVLELERPQPPGGDPAR